MPGIAEAPTVAPCETLWLDVERFMATEAGSEESFKSKLLGLKVEFDGEDTSFGLSDFLRSLSQLEIEFLEGDIECGEDAMVEYAQSLAQTRKWRWKWR